jgi:hypothetical protein
MTPQGILPGWWLGASDSRSLEPFVTPSRWDVELRAAGFSGTDTVVYDDDEPYQMNANIVSRPLSIDLQHGERRISILTGSAPILEVQGLQAILVQHGYHPEYYTVDDSLPVNQDIISTLDLSGPFFYNISIETFTRFQNLTTRLGTNRLLWLTRSSQITCEDPRFSLVLGLARTLRAEQSIDFTTLELDGLDSQAWQSVVAVFEKIRNRHEQLTGSDIDPDYEYVLSKGIVQVGRYHAVKVPHQLPTPKDTTAPKKLKIGKLGLLQSLTWEQQATFTELGQDELEIEPCCVGLNFRVTSPVTTLSCQVNQSEGRPFFNGHHRGQ